MPSSSVILTCEAPQRSHQMPSESSWLKTFFLVGVRVGAKRRKSSGLAFPP